VVLLESLTMEALRAKGGGPRSESRWLRKPLVRELAILCAEDAGLPDVASNTKALAKTVK
jgi:hypothetical protein